MEEIKAGLYRLDLNENFLASTSSSSATGLSAISPINIAGTILSHDASGVTPGTYHSVAVNASGHVTSGSNPVIDISSGTNLAVTSPIVLTGDTLSHATSGVGAGTYRSVAVDTLGHVTAGSNPTIDISGDTNLAAISPITLTGDTVGFDFSTNNTWAGTNNFNNTITLQDDDKLFIGDNSSLGGNASVYLDMASSGNIILQAENSWPGYVSSNLLFQIGPTLSAPQATPATATHRLFVTNNETSTTGAIAGIFEVEYSGASANSSAIQGLNVFSHNTSGAGNLTATTNGGGLRSRVLTRQRSTSGTVAQMSGYSFKMVQDVSTGAVTLMTPVNIESPDVGATTGEFRGINFESAAVASTLTTNKFIHIPSMLAGTNRYEVWFDGDAGSFYRSGGQQINSSAASTLDVDTTTTLNFRVGTAIEATITANLLAFNNGATDTYLNWATDAILKIGSGATDIVNLTTGTTVFNEAAADLDFRFEGVADANLLFTDAGNSRIGIGNAAPSYKLDVTGQINASEDIAVASDKKIYLEGMTGDTYISYVSGSTKVRFYVNGVLAMELE